MAPSFVFLLVAAVAAENRSLDDGLTLIQQQLARPNGSPAAEIMKRGACQAVVFDRHDRKRPNDSPPGGLPPYEMNLGFSDNSCQRLGAPNYKVRSGTFWAHAGCSLILYEGEECDGHGAVTVWGWSRPARAQFRTKSRLHPRGDEGRFFRSARCRCPDISGLSMVASGEAAGQEESSEEVAEAKDEQDEEAKAREEQSEDEDVKDAQVEEDVVEKDEEEAGTVENASSLGDFVGSRSCLFHSNSGKLFEGDDNEVFFDVRGGPRHRRRRRVRSLCLNSFPASDPGRRSFYMVVEKGCSLYLHGLENCRGPYGVPIDNTHRSDREAGSSFLVADFPYWFNTKSVRCRCVG